MSRGVSFDWVKIRHGIGLPRGGRWLDLVVADRGWIERLAHFFPDAIQGRESSIAGGWLPKYIIEFEKGGRVALQVLIHPQCRSYAFRGDWPLAPGLDAFILEAARR